MKKVIIALLINTLSISSFTYAQEVTTSSGMMDHAHLPISVPKTIDNVSLSLSLVKDVMSGYNLTLLTNNYMLVPPPSEASMSTLMSATINTQSGFLEGHAHLYINGDKIQRVYGSNVHLPQVLFREGINSISVTLNNHGHMYWTMKDKKILSTLYINTSSPEPLVKNKFESFPSI